MKKRISTQEEEGMKALWLQCFHDDPQWVERFFHHFGTTDTCRHISRGGTAVATLYNIARYRFTAAGHYVPAAYFYALCTHPCYRNQGLMGQLITETLQQLYLSRCGMAVLIPAETWLFDYYARFGFAPVFRRRTVPLSEGAASLSCSASLDLHPSRRDILRFLLHHPEQHPVSLRPTASTLSMTLDDLALSDGLVCGLRTDEGRMCAVAMVYPRPSGRLVELLRADNSSASSALCHRLNDLPLMGTRPMMHLPSTPQAPGTPFGMARIVHAEHFLRFYAACFPAAEQTFQLIDPQITANQGCYHLQHGKCKKEVRPPHPGYRTLTIGQLADELLTPLYPFMSLMWE